MSNEDIIDKLEGLKAFYAGLHPELANTYVEALDTAINAVRFTFDPKVVYDTDLFSRRLRELMENKHIKGRDLADMVQMHESSISCYIYGTREPKLSTVVALARALDAPVCYLMGLRGIGGGENGTD